MAVFVLGLVSYLFSRGGQFALFGVFCCFGWVVRFVVFCCFRVWVGWFSRGLLARLKVLWVGIIYCLCCAFWFATCVGCVCAGGLVGLIVVLGLWFLVCLCLWCFDDCFCSGLLISCLFSSGMLQFALFGVVLLSLVVFGV